MGLGRDSGSRRDRADRFGATLTGTRSGPPSVAPFAVITIVRLSATTVKMTSTSAPIFHQL
jgi:hypothetical protein